MATVTQKDYYEVLGVKEDASTEDIRKVYREHAKKYHPDKTGGDEKAEAVLKEINEAYDVLKNPEKRKQYDQQRVFAGAQGFEGFDFSRGFAEGGIGDIFESMFGRGGGTTTRRAARTGNDIEGRVRISLKDVVAGTSKTIRLRRADCCDACKGSGAMPGTAPVTCEGCGGSGTQTRGDNRFRFSQTCTRCRGSGEVIKTPCSTCSGTGHVAGSREIKVDIPAGVRSGVRLRVPGEGGAGEPGASRGDLYVRVEIETDPFFTRDGANLVCEVPVTIVQAALGTKIQVPTLDGVAELKLKAGTQNGAMLRMRGLGLPSFGGTARGDELIRIMVEIPRALSREQKKLLRQFEKPDTPEEYPARNRFMKLLEKLRGLGRD